MKSAATFLSHLVAGGPYENYDSILSDSAMWERTPPKSDPRVGDLHAPTIVYIQPARQTNPTFFFVKEGIHPGPLGHPLPAEAPFRGLDTTPPGLDGNLSEKVAKAETDDSALQAQIDKLRTAPKS